MKDNASTRNFINFLSFASLIIVAILVFINQLLPLVGVTISGTFFVVLNTIKEIFVVLVIALNAYRFVVGKAKWVQIIYWISVVLFITGIVLIWVA